MTARRISGLLLLGSASACGLSVSGSGSPATRGETVQALDGAAPSSTSASTSPGASASPSEEAGASAFEEAGASEGGSAPLACTSASDCNGNRDCCFGQDVGAYCGKPCRDTDSVLCRVGIDGCSGEGMQCVALPSLLPANVGRCIHVGDG
jgi:hypothetical protein